MEGIPDIPSEPRHLRILIANERADRLERVSRVVEQMGHTVIARALNAGEAGTVTREERPDVALVGLGEHPSHALAHITRIVDEAICPVVALLHDDDPDFVSEAAKRGIFAYITDGTSSEIQSAIDIVLARFADYQALQVHHHADVDIDQTAEDRDRNAEDRDERAEAHDRAAEACDERARARDDRAVARELVQEVVDRGAAADRTAALRDRRGTAADRSQAAEDRKAAAVDRALSARERASSCTDELTGAHRREAGLMELTREVARAKRARHPLVLAFVDVDGLKGTNDSLGHAAGDHVLRATVYAIRAHLRPYDLIVRFGGDEFVCALPDLTVAEAAARFSLANADLMANHHTSTTVGLADLRAADTADDLLARADRDLYRQRHLSRSASL